MLTSAIERVNPGNLVNSQGCFLKTKKRERRGRKERKKVERERKESVESITWSCCCCCFSLSLSHSLPTHYDLLLLRYPLTQ